MLPQSPSLRFDNIDAFITNWPPKELQVYAKDYLNNKNSTSILLMPSKYDEF